MPASKDVQERLKRFDDLPDSAGVSFSLGGVLLERDRTRLYNDIKEGRLKSFHVGRSHRIQVGSIRALLNGSQ